MTLAPGSRLGPYEIVAPLGAGGMGEVYQARDSRLGRDVAIKILPEGVAAPAVFARFEREARLCSSLTHPNVVTVHELAEADGTPYIAMELVRGESLRALLGRRMPPKRALALAAQIADGLAAAHACGIVHRDLKPENVMVTAGGVAKVLDFGVARLESETVAETAAATDVRLTREGALLGTIGYMSPEQARGESVDFRSDQFSFGVMLYEMLAGRNPFARASVAASVAAILNDDPDPLDRVTGVPPEVAAIVERCLAKEPEERYGSTADLAHDLRRSGTAAPARRAPVVRRLWWAIPLALLLLAGAFALGRFFDRDRETPALPMRLAVGILAEAIQFGETSIPLAISSDGRTIVMSAMDADRSQYLWAHDLVLGTTMKLEGTESGYSPTWNDEGTAVAFFAEGKLKTVPIAGGPPRVLCDASPEGKAAWSGGSIVFSQIRGGPSIWIVPAAGGEPRQIVPPQEGKGPFWPEFLPDGRRFLFLYTVNPTKQKPERTHELMLASLDGGEPKLVAAIDSRAVWVDTGHLLFVRDGTLFAQKFDPDAPALIGEAVALASDVHYFFSTGLAAFSVSRVGVLVWRTPREEVELTWVDRRGTVLSVVGRGRFEKGHMSDDGEQYATAVADLKLGIASLWTWDVARGSGVRISFTSFDERAPVWTPDGSIYFRTDENGAPDIHLRRAGQEKGTPFVVRSGVQEPLEVSPDGRWLLFGEANRTSGGDIWIVPTDAPEKARPFLRTPSTEWSPRFSPDGEFVAYHSNASGRMEIYVRAFDGSGQPVRVSNEGGSEPRWRGDGRELYYLAPDGAMMAAPIERAGAAIRPSAPSILFRSSGALDFEVTPGGDRFLVRSPTGRTVPSIRLLTDWRAALR